MQCRLLVESNRDIVWIYNVMLNQFTFISPAFHRLLMRQDGVSDRLFGEESQTKRFETTLKKKVRNAVMSWFLGQQTEFQDLFTSLDLGDSFIPPAQWTFRWSPVVLAAGGVSDLIGICQGVDSFKEITQSIQPPLKGNVSSSGTRRRSQKRKRNIAVLNRYELQKDMLYNLVDQHPDIMILVDANGIIEYVNNAFVQETGESSGQLIGKSFDQELSKYYNKNPQYLSLIKSLNKAESWSGTLFRLAPESGGTWEKITTSPVIYDKDASHHVAITIQNVHREKMEIEEQKRHNRQGMKKLIDTHDTRIIGLIEGEERERKRFARDLHDGLGQILTAAKYCLEGLSEIIPVKFTEEYKICCELLGSAIAETRNISHGLMPTSLADFGLITALSDLCRHTFLINGQVVSFDHRMQDDFYLEDFKQLMIFRIVQEGLNNVQKHAGATQASVSLKRENEQVVLQIADNGLGFEPQLATSGLGLMSIRNRVKLLGGCCNIKSETGKGTMIRITFHHQKNWN